jgi:hypothetical protein
MIKHKLRILWLIPVFSLLLLLGCTRPSHAAQFKTGDYTLEESQIVEENLYVNGETVDIAGVVDGDLIVGADSITVSGTVTGDLYAGGSKIEISGNVYGSTFLAGQTVDLSGSVARNSYIGAMFADISGSVGKDAIVFSSNSNVSGKITEDVRVFATRSLVSGTIKGEALIYSPSSTIDEELVSGEVYENVGEEENIQKVEVPMHTSTSLSGMFLGVNVFSTLIGFVSMYIVGVVLIYLAPVKTIQIEEKVIGSAQDFLFNLLVGLGITVLIPLPLIILTFTLIGAPLALLITAGLAFMAMFGKIWVESAIGQKILSTTDKDDPKRLLSLLIGRGLSTVANFIPIVRGLYRSILGMTAIGAIVRMKYDVFKNMKSSKKKSKK